MESRGLDDREKDIHYIFNGKILLSEIYILTLTWVFDRDLPIGRQLRKIITRMWGISWILMRDLVLEVVKLNK